MPTCRRSGIEDSCQLPRNAGQAVANLLGVGIVDATHAHAPHVTDLQFIAYGQSELQRPGTGSHGCAGHTAGGVQWRENSGGCEIGSAVSQEHHRTLAGSDIAGIGTLGYSGSQLGGDHFQRLHGVAIALTGNRHAPGLAQAGNAAEADTGHGGGCLCAADHTACAIDLGAGDKAGGCGVGNHQGIAIDRGQEAAARGIDALGQSGGHFAQIHRGAHPIADGVLDQTAAIVKGQAQAPDIARYRRAGQIDAMGVGYGRVGRQRRGLGADGKTRADGVAGGVDNQHGNAIHPGAQVATGIGVDAVGQGIANRLQRVALHHQMAELPDAAGQVQRDGPGGSHFGRAAENQRAGRLRRPRCRQGDAVTGDHSQVAHIDTVSQMGGQVGDAGACGAVGKCRVKHLSLVRQGIAQLQSPILASLNPQHFQCSLTPLQGKEIGQTALIRRARHFGLAIRTGSNRDAQHAAVRRAETQLGVTQDVHQSLCTQDMTIQIQAIQLVGPGLNDFRQHATGDGYVTHTGQQIVYAITIGIDLQRP